MVTRAIPCSCGARIGLVWFCVLMLVAILFMLNTHTNYYPVSPTPKADLHTSSIKVQEPKNKVIFADRKTNIQTLEPDLPIIYVITPTHIRLEQKADLTRMSHTLRLVKNIHWIIVEDSENKTNLVSQLLNNSRLHYTHLTARTPTEFRIENHASRLSKRRGVVQRNAGIHWVRTDPFPAQHQQGGVLYFADDDNTYSVDIFEEMRSTKKVSVWPVGLTGGFRFERPIVKDNKVVKWFSAFRPDRAFAMDMAGFAVNMKIILQHPKAGFSDKDPPGYLETNFLSNLGISKDDLEPKADLCTKILVWHTRTEKTIVKGEGTLKKKYGKDFLNMEV